MCTHLVKRGFLLCRLRIVWMSLCQTCGWLNIWGLYLEMGYHVILQHWRLGLSRLLERLEHLLELTVRMPELKQATKTEHWRHMQCFGMMVYWTCWPCEDWKSWATAAKASEFCSCDAGACTELTDTAVWFSASLAGEGGDAAGEEQI